MTVLVTGGAGFIGSRVVRKLVERGERVVSFGPTPVRGALLRHGDAIIPFRGDVSRLGEVLAAVRQNKVRRIIHMASFLTLRTQSDPYGAFLVSGLGACNVFEVARWSDVERVVYASSIACYGPQDFYGDRPLNEDAPTSPRTLYGALKLANEMAAQRYREEHGLDLCGVRIATAFGHAEAAGLTGWVRSLFSLPGVGQPVQVPVAPRARAPFVYVDDVAELLLLALDAGKVAPVYLCGGYRSSVADLVDALRRYVPDARVTYGDAVVPFAYLLDHSRAKRDLGFDLPPLERRVLDHINEARSEAGLPPLAR